VKAKQTSKIQHCMVMCNLWITKIELKKYVWKMDYLKMAHVIHMNNEQLDENTNYKMMMEVILISQIFGDSK